MPLWTRREALHLLSAAVFAPGANQAPVEARSEPAPTAAAVPQPLSEFPYISITLQDAGMLAQRANVSEVLLSLSPDDLLRPLLAMAGRPAPGATLGGWYEWNPSYDYRHDSAGLAPASTLGQWISAMARLHASGGDAMLQARALELRTRLDDAISPRYFAQSRFAAYSYDKLVCGLMDAHRLMGDPQAFSTLDKVTAAAGPSLPGRALDRDFQWYLGRDSSWMWDESYTLPENLYLVSAMGAGSAYRTMAEAYLDDKTYFEPLSRGENVLGDKHAYSYVNALCSAMQAALTGGSAMHLRAAQNGFRFLVEQSFATGGWGPDELLRRPGYDEVAKTLTTSHNSFETPCGSYAHAKLTRYLLRATRDGAYGDSMERVLQNTTRGALPLQPDGTSFYNSDYNVDGKRTYTSNKWPCCSGTLPQVVGDYGINGYLQAPGAVWVVLYQASELRWRENGVGVMLAQTGSYLDDGAVQLQLRTDSPVRFALHLRVPAWAGETRLAVNGRPQSLVVEKGFAVLERTWRTGDEVTLTVSFALRLEPLPANGGPAHPDTVALLWGPRVLFAVREPGDTGPIVATEAALLAAERLAPERWRVATKAGDRVLGPFTKLGEQRYSTYLKLA